MKQHTEGSNVQVEVRRGKVRVDTDYQVKQHTEGSNVQVVVRRVK